MKPVPERSWILLHLRWFLIGGLVDSASLSSATTVLSVSSTVGSQVALPCSWKSRLQQAAAPGCHIQWTNPVDTVFEQQGALKWQAEEFKDRVEVPEDQLSSGNCSLIVSDVQIRDAGNYDSFMVVDGARSRKTRVFIQRVSLLVYDHKSHHFGIPGENLVLELHTRHFVRVIFQHRNSSEWSDLWMRGDANTERVEKHLLKEQLTIKKLKGSDEGLYKVLDEQGLAVSTVDLSMQGSSTSARGVLTGDAAKSRCSALLISALLVVTFQAPGF